MTFFRIHDVSTLSFTFTTQELQRGVNKSSGDMDIPLHELPDEQCFITGGRENISLEPQESQPGSSIAFDHKNDHTAYAPTFLRFRVLIAFAVVFAGLFGLLQFLYSYSQHHQGISQSDESRRYLWTYGPTAILVLIAVLWRQVDYAAKLILP